MTAGGQSGGLGCKEEKFAASKMVLSRRPQSQSTQLLVRRMGAEARLSPVPACGPPFTLATTPGRTTSHTHTLLAYIAHPFCWSFAAITDILNLSSTDSQLACSSGLLLLPVQFTDTAQCVRLGRFRKMRQFICSTVHASTRCAL